MKAKVGASTLVFVKSEMFQITKGRDQIATYPAEHPDKYDRFIVAMVLWTGL